MQFLFAYRLTLLLYFVGFWLFCLVLEFLLYIFFLVLIAFIASLNYSKFPRMLLNPGSLLFSLLTHSPFYLPPCSLMLQFLLKVSLIKGSSFRIECLSFWRSDMYLRKVRKDISMKYQGRSTVPASSCFLPDHP